MGPPLLDVLWRTKRIHSRWPSQLCSRLAKRDPITLHKRWFEGLIASEQAKSNVLSTCRGLIEAEQQKITGRDEE
jgi:hypothetical protein